MELKPFFFSFSFWKCWFSPCCDEISLLFVSSYWRFLLSSFFVGQYDSKKIKFCILSLLGCLEGVLPKGCSSVYFCSAFSILSKGSYVCFVPGKCEFFTCPDKNPGFPAQIKETFLTVESTVIQDSWHSPFFLFCLSFFSYCIILFLIFLVPCKVWRATVS